MIMIFMYRIKSNYTNKKVSIWILPVISIFCKVEQGASKSTQAAIDVIIVYAVTAANVRNWKKENYICLKKTQKKIILNNVLSIYS